MPRGIVHIRENARIAWIAAGRLGTNNIAIVIGRTIYLHGVSREEFLQRQAWVCHELKHVEQYQRLGTIGFLVRYLLESIRHGYRNNRFEVEARAAESDVSLLERYEIQER